LNKTPTLVAASYKHQHAKSVQGQVAEAWCFLSCRTNFLSFRVSSFFWDTAALVAKAPLHVLRQPAALQLRLRYWHHIGRSAFATKAAAQLAPRNASVLLASWQHPMAKGALQVA
jgi:hypothetical protein